VKALQEKVNNLITRYHQVDPEEHKTLQSKFQEGEKKVTKLEQDVSAQWWLWWWWW